MLRLLHMRNVSLIIGRGFTLVKMAAGKFARDFERVPEIEEVAPKDFVAIKRARDQQGRDRSFNSNVFLYKNLPWLYFNSQYMCIIYIYIYTYIYIYIYIYNTGLLDWRW